MSTQQILTVVGTVVGAYFGYPGLGAALGSVAGAMLTPGVDGPKLDDLKANKVSYGEVIPYVEGHPRIAPVLAWQSTKQEIEEGGGGCGGGVTQYSYICDVVFILGENQCGPPVRGWYNNELVYNVSSSADDETVGASVENTKWVDLVYHNGDESQLPDSVYEAAVGDVPAFRGKSTVGIRGLKLIGPEGVFPQIQFEVAGTEAGESFGKTLRMKKNWAEADFRGVPPEGASRAGLAVIGITGSGVQTYRHNNTTQTDTIPDGVPLQFLAQGNGDVALAVWGTIGTVCEFAWAGSGHSIKIESENPNDYTGSAELRFSVFKFQIALASSLPYETGENFFTGCLGTQGVVYIHDLETGAHIHTHTFYPTVSRADSLALNESTLWVFDGEDIYEYSREDYLLKNTITPPTGTGHRIFISHDGSLCVANEAAQVYRWEQIIDDFGWNLLATLDNAEGDDDHVFPADYLGTGNAHHMVRSGSVYAVVTTERELEGPPEVETYYIQPGWSGGSLHPDFGYNSIGEIASKFAFIDGGAFGGTPCGWAVSFEWGEGLHRRASSYLGYEIVSSEPFPSGNPEFQPITEIWLRFHATRYYGYPGDSGQPPGFYATTHDLAIYQATITNTEKSLKKYVDVYRKRFDVDTYDLTEPTLEDVTRRQCLRGGFAEEDMDFTDLATKNVRALALSQIVSPDSILDILSDNFFYNFKEGEQLVGEFLGKEHVAVIQYADMGADGGEPMEIGKSNDLETPSQRIAKYMNVDDDYQNGSEESDRLLSVGQSIQTEEIPIGFTPTEMKRIVDIKANLPAVGNRTGTIALSRKFSRLQAGDTVLTADYNDSVRRIRFRACNYERGIYKFDWVLDDADAYLSAAEASSNYLSTTIVRPIPVTDFALIDAKLLDDSLDGPSLLVAAKGLATPWPGYVMQRGVDQTSYAEIYRSEKQATMGVCSTVLGTWFGPHMVDEVNRVTVDLGPKGKLLSITRNELYASKFNTALVGTTVLRFQKARQIALGVYEISRLLYLSDPILSIHSVGERFVLLEASKLDRIPMNFAELGLSKFYRGVTYNQNVLRALSVQYSAQFVALKPLAPVNVVAVDKANGDILIRGNRRTRLSSNALRGIVPLGETTEAYNLEIYDGTTLKRSLDLLSIQYTWTAAAIAADFPSGGLATIKLRQLGALPGYQATITKLV